MNTIHILAGDYSQFTNYLTKQKDIAKTNYRCVDSLASINGVANGHIIVVSGGMSRGDWKSVLEYCDRTSWEIEIEDNK